MNLYPKKQKHRKVFKGKGFFRVPATQKGSTLNFGQYGLQACEYGRLTSQQIESARKAIVRKLQRTGKLWIRIFPDLPVTAKPSEIRMGKGKGPREYWCVKVKEQKILFELDFVPAESAKQAFRLAGHKLPIRTQFITNKI